MNKTGALTRSEIYSQPLAWQAAFPVIQEYGPMLRQLWAQKNYVQVIFTGCGSTYYLSLAAAAVFQEVLGVPAAGKPASELWHYPRIAYPAYGNLLLVAVSRSGETTETLRACETFLANGRGDLLTLSCYPQAPLVSLGTLNLVFPSGAEESIAQTRAFSTLYLGTVGLALHCGQRQQELSSLERLPATGRCLLDSYSTRASNLGRDPKYDRFYFLGSGLRYGLACELSLKMKEMTLSHSESFHFMEFRHGPKSMVTASTLIVGLRSELNASSEAAVLAEMRGMGADVLEIAEDSEDVALHSGVPELIRNVLYLPVGQVLALEHAALKKLNPDRPHNLDAVVKLPE